MQREDIKVLVKKWWDIYNDKSLDYMRKPQSPAVATNATDCDQAEAVNMQPFLDALSEAGAVQFVTAPSAA